MSLISLTLSTNKIEKMNIKKIVRSLYEKDKNILSFSIHFRARKTNWALDYMLDGKGVIPYKKIKSFDNLDFVPDQDGFFARTGFYSTLRNEIISDGEYERVRKFCNLLQLRKLELD